MVLINCNDEEEDVIRRVDDASSPCHVLWKDGGGGETNATTECASSINPYHVLNVACDATKEEITTAYRKLALLHHPCRCRNNHNDDAFFTLIHASYETLIDTAVRQRYDNNTSNLHEYSPQQGHDDERMHYGPLADMYQARFYAPFRNPYELFDDVFQCHMMFSSSPPPPCNYTNTSMRNLATTTTAKISSSLSNTKQDAALVTDDNDFFCFHNILTSVCFHLEPADDGNDCRWTNTSTTTTDDSSSFWNNFVQWWCCGPFEGDANIPPSSCSTTVSSIVPSIRSTTSSTYLFSDFLKTSSWIGTSKLISRDQYVCQISKLLGGGRITKTEITKRLDDGTTQTQISVLRRESTISDHNDDFQKLVLSCTTSQGDASSNTFKLQQTTKKEKRQRKKQQPFKR